MTGTKVMSSNLDEIMKALEEGVHAFMESDTYKTYLRAVSKFHNYSTKIAAYHNAHFRSRSNLDS